LGSSQVRPAAQAIRAARLRTLCVHRVGSRNIASSLHTPILPRIDTALTRARFGHCASQLYMAGHGGDGFMKFQDQEELTSSQLADALATMHAQASRRLLLLTKSNAWPPAALDRRPKASLAFLPRTGHIVRLWMGALMTDSMRHPGRAGPLPGAAAGGGDVPGGVAARAAAVAQRPVHRRQQSRCPSLFIKLLSVPRSLAWGGARQCVRHYTSPCVLHVASLPRDAICA